MLIGSIFHRRPYLETTVLLFTTICSAFTSGNFKSFERRQVKVSQKQYGGKPKNKEIYGCSINSQSISKVIKRLDRHFHVCIRSHVVSCVRFASTLSYSERQLKRICPGYVTKGQRFQTLVGGPRGVREK